MPFLSWFCQRSLLKCAEHSQQVTRKRTQRLLPEDEDGYLRYLVYTIEKVIRSMENAIDQWIWILDLKGISLPVS